MSEIEIVRRKAFEDGWLAHSMSKEGSYADRVKALSKYLSKFKNPISIIFLDIDGVLNNAFDADRHHFPDDPRGYFYSPRCVDILNRLIKDSGAKVVVSSTWRLGRTLEEMQDVLKKIGVECDCIGLTPQLSHTHLRGNEIYNWMESNKDLIGHHYDFKRYIILDDDSDMLLWQKDNYVNCDPNIGMTERTYYKALSILLNAPCEDVGQEYI